MATAPSSKPEDVDSSQAESQDQDAVQENTFTETVGIGGAQFNGKTIVNINHDSSGNREREQIGSKSSGQIIDLTINENLTLEQALGFVTMFNNRIGASRRARLIFIEEGSTHLFLDVSYNTRDQIIKLQDEGRLEKLIQRAKGRQQLSILNLEVISDKRIIDKVVLIKQIHAKGAKSDNLSGTNLSGANLSGVNLSRVNLSGADLSGAFLRLADLSGANLRSAKLIRANLSGANLFRANLSGANLFRANLSGSLRLADLSVADLRQADLRGADLIWADLSGADLRGADLTQADFSQAILNGCTFSNNPELSQAQIVDMKNRGALFIDSPESDVPSLVLR